MPFNHLRREEGTMKSDISVVVVTVCRDSLYRSIRSIFTQDFEGTIQILIGVDVERFGSISQIMEALARECPPRITLTCINPGYSTSARHGGVHSCWFGGSLRTALSFLASSELVAYLDDDDWYQPQHLRLLHKAIQGKSWAFTLSNYADPNNDRILGPDKIESLGPNKGVFKDKFGGFVRPSALLLNKINLLHILHLWSFSPFPSGDGEDRLIFNELLKFHDYGETGVPTVNCALDPADGMHAFRLQSLSLPAAKAVAKQQTLRTAP
ncbi:MAG TPA: hypothetical protein VJ623_08800 [Holophagaceae bacterium]|nr:hypothetical protein [Holophagaceae bacterium]